MTQCWTCGERTEDLAKGLCKVCRKIVNCSNCGRQTQNKYGFGRCLKCWQAEQDANERTARAMQAARRRGSAG